MSTPTPARTVADIIAGHPIVLPNETRAHMDYLSSRFDASYETSNPITAIFNRHIFRHHQFGGERVANQALRDYGATIDAVSRDISVEGPNHQRVHPGATLMRAVLYVENNYNADGLLEQMLGHSVMPMNVNYDVWGSLLARNGITKHDIQDPAKNIRAAGIILAQIDANLPHRPGETPAIRAAQIASIYGNTELTLGTSGGKPGIINYGAKVGEEYDRMSRMCMVGEQLPRLNGVTLDTPGLTAATTARPRALATGQRAL